MSSVGFANMEIASQRVEFGYKLKGVKGAKIHWMNDNYDWVERMAEEAIRELDYEYGIVADGAEFYKRDVILLMSPPVKTGNPQAQCDTGGIK